MNSLTPSALPAIKALRQILDATFGECEHYTTGIGSCFEAGRTPDAQYGADRCCTSCIAHKALAALTPSDVAPQAETAKSDKANLTSAVPSGDLPTGTGEDASGVDTSDPCTVPDCDCEPGWCREHPAPKRTKGVTDGVRACVWCGSTTGQHPISCANWCPEPPAEVTR